MEQVALTFKPAQYAALNSCNGSLSFWNEDLSSKTFGFWYLDYFLGH